MRTSTASSGQSRRTAANQSKSQKTRANIEGDNVYVAPLPLLATGQEGIKLDRKTAAFTITPASLDGGVYPRWRDANTIEYANANKYFVYHLDTAKTDTTEIHLSVQRAIPQGTIALQNARLVTLANKKVIDSGTIVIKSGRITCVGNCQTAGVDRVIDAKGKTIIPGFVDMHAHHHRERSEEHTSELQSQS